jgi:hypothetical protein
MCTQELVPLDLALKALILDSDHLLCCIAPKSDDWLRTEAIRPTTAGVPLESVISALPSAASLFGTAAPPPRPAAIYALLLPDARAAAACGDELSLAAMRSISNLAARCQIWRLRSGARVTLAEGCWLTPAAAAAAAASTSPTGVTELSAMGIQSQHRL